MPSVSNVEKTDLATGKLAYNFSGAVDLLTVGTNAGSQNKRPARAFVADGAVTVTMVDGSNIALPDRGSFWYDLAIIAVVSGDGTAIW